MKGWLFHPNPDQEESLVAKTQQVLAEAIKGQLLGRTMNPETLAKAELIVREKLNQLVAGMGDATEVSFEGDEILVHVKDTQNAQS